MARQTIPNSNGIYKNLRHPKGEYSYLISTEYAVGCTLGDATECNRQGTPREGYECPVPYQAEAFGRRVGVVSEE